VGYKNTADRPIAEKGGAVTEEGTPVAYTVLRKGTPVTSQSGRWFGTVDRVIDDSKGDILHGIIVATAVGRRFVARDCIERMATTQVRCSLSDEQTGALPPAPSGRRFKTKSWFVRGT
jgi:hypothetical protein